MTLEKAQIEILCWAEAVFKEAERENDRERVLRHVEEAVELAQVVGVRPEQIHKLVDYVFSRPAGTPAQEVAGSLVTLLAAANTLGVDVPLAFALELDKIWEPEIMERIRRRQAEKREVTG